MTIHWKAVEQYFAVVLVFQFYSVFNFGLGSVRSESINPTPRINLQFVALSSLGDLDYVVLCSTFSMMTMWCEFIKQLDCTITVTSLGHFPGTVFAHCGSHVDHGKT